MTKPEDTTTPAGAPFERPVMPCPLCGQQPRVVDLAGWEVLCNCGLALVLDTPNKDSLLAAWNTRATGEAALAADARRWRSVCARHGMTLTRLATGSSSYSSHKKQAILDAWADMAAAEVEGFDPDAFHADIVERITELSASETKASACPNAAHMAEHACTNRHQCWEPCGELGHSEAHAKRHNGDKHDH